MLSIPTEFPLVGSTGYLIGSAQTVRIIGRDHAGNCLVSIQDQRFPNEKASGNRRVALSELRETPEEAALVNKPRYHHGAARYPRRNTI